MTRRVPGPDATDKVDGMVSDRAHTLAGTGTLRYAW